MSTSNISPTRPLFGRVINSRSVMTHPEVSGGGNLILRVGHTYGDGSSWEKTEHVVITPDEWREFVRAGNELLSAQIPVRELDKDDVIAGSLTVDSCEMHGDRVRIVCWGHKEDTIEVAS